MKLLYSYIGRLHACTKKTAPLYKYVFTPANTGYRLVMSGRQILSIIFCFSILAFHLMVLKNIRILSLGFLCFMLFSLPMAWAQSAETRAAERQTEMKPLQIGDTIPEQLWHLPLNVVNHPTGKDTITLNDYRHKKLIVLDFWATWCGLCVPSLLIVDSMISDFKDVQLLLVTNENADKIRKFRSPQYAPLFSIVERHNLKDYFPHQFIPHQVWMMDNKVIATTGNDDLTVSNIQDALHGKWDGLSEKKDIDIDYFTPISTYAKDASAEIFTFSCFTGYMKGTGNSGHLKAGKRQTFYMLNRPIFSMYREALGIFPNRIVDRKSVV